MSMYPSCYSPTCSTTLHPLQDRCYSASCPDVESRLTANLSDAERKAFVDLRVNQNDVITALESLQTDVENLKNTVKTSVQNEDLLKALSLSDQTSKSNICDIVIMAPPSRPPLSLFVLRNLLKKHFRVTSKVHVHSSVKNVADKLRRVFVEDNSEKGSELRSNYDLALTLIWRDTRFNRPQMVIDLAKQSVVMGEVNVGRYMRRFLPHHAPEELGGATRATESDLILDLVSSLMAKEERGDGGSSSNDKEKAALVKVLASRLCAQAWIADGEEPGVEDAVVWSHLARGKNSTYPAAVTSWLKKCNQNSMFREAQTLLQS